MFRPPGPGYDLSVGSSGSKVLQMQEQLNVIAEAYPALPRVDTDGIYGPATQAGCGEISVDIWIACNWHC